MAPDPDLTDRQAELIHHLPGGSETLAEEMCISRSRVRAVICQIRDKGIDIPYDRESKTFYLEGEEKVRRVSIKHTGTKTREANDYVTELEKTILRRLASTDELVAPQNPEPGNEDMVVHFTDLHVGDVVENEHGQEIYNTQIATEVVETVTKNTLKLKETMGRVAEFDTLHVCYGGDMITNENIYDGQAFDIESMLADQMTTAVKALANQLKSFSEQFETVNVICQPGNHGKTRASGVSKQANMDLVSYRWLKDRIAESPYNNLNFKISEATWYKTFDLRGGQWTGFLTHGQDSLKHADSTAASSRDWRGWLNKFGFDIAYRGHYHESRREPIQNGPFVFESPSPKPAGEFADRIGQPSTPSDAKRLATVHGSSDKRPVTWECVIDDLG